MIIWAGRGESGQSLQSLCLNQSQSGNNKNWCDLVSGSLVMVTMTGRGIMGHAPSLCCGKHQTDRVSNSHTHKHKRSIKRNFIPVHFRCFDTTVQCDSGEARDPVTMTQTGPVT